jgi:hypothetical protein
MLRSPLRPPTIGDRAGEALTRQSGQSYTGPCNYPTAYSLFSEALATYRAIGDRRGSLYPTSWDFHTRLTEYDTALAFPDEALEFQRN